MKSKKILSVVLILVSLTIIMFSGCTKTTEKSTSLPNPMVEKASTAEIKDTLGFTFDSLPANITDVKYYTISDNLAQVDFTSNGIEYTVRKAENAGADISGVYNELPNTQTIANSAGNDVLYKSDDNGMGLATWNAGNDTYSVFCDTGFDLTAMQAVVDAVL